MQVDALCHSQHNAIEEKITHYDADFNNDHT